MTKDDTLKELRNMLARRTDALHMWRVAYAETPMNDPMRRANLETMIGFVSAEVKGLSSAIAMIEGA